MKKALLGSLVSAALLTSFNLSAATAGQAVDAQAATDNASKVSQQKIDSYAESAESALAQYRPPCARSTACAPTTSKWARWSTPRAPSASMQKQIAQIDQTSTEVVPLMLKMIDSSISSSPWTVPEGGA
jgi:hypothetical protein